MVKLKSDTKIYPDNYGAIKSKGKRSALLKKYFENSLLRLLEDGIIFGVFIIL